MITALRARLALMTRRERVLVVAAAWLTAAVVLVYGVILPVGRAFDAADRRHADATVRAARLVATLRQLDGKPGGAPAVGASGPVEGIVATAAEQAGLVVQSNQPRGESETQVVIPTARATVALRWLDSLGQQGLVVDALTMSPSPDGTVAVSVTLRRVPR